MQKMDSEPEDMLKLTEPSDPARAEIRSDPEHGAGTKAVTGVLRAPLFLILAILSTLFSLLLCIIAMQPEFLMYIFVLFALGDLLDALFNLLLLCIPAVPLILIPVGLWQLNAEACISGCICGKALNRIRIALKIPFLALAVVVGIEFLLAAYTFLTAGVFYLAWPLPENLFPKLPYDVDFPRSLLQLLQFLLGLLWFIGTFRTVKALRFTARTGRSAEPISLLGAILSLLIGAVHPAWLLFTGSGSLSWETLRRFPDWKSLSAIWLLLFCAALLCYGALALWCRARMRRAAADSISPKKPVNP